MRFSTKRNGSFFTKRKLLNISNEFSMNKVNVASLSGNNYPVRSWCFSSKFYAFYNLTVLKLSYRNALLITIMLVLSALIKNLYIGLEGSRLSKFYRSLLEADGKSIISLFLPPRTVSRVVYFLSTVERPEFFRRFLLNAFMAMAEIDLSDSEKETLYDYKNIQELFTRNMKPGLRTPDKDAMLVSPCDGTIVNSGIIRDENFIFEYIKNQPVSLRKLYDSDVFPTIKHGNKLCYIIFYLAPHNYHRFHSPTDWTVEVVKKVKGTKKSVSISFLTMLPGYACKNERIILEGSWKEGYFCMVPIAAMNVGGIEISKLKGYENTPSVKWNFKEMKDVGIRLDKGMEVGRFLLGSSIVLLFEAPEEFDFAILNEGKVNCGQKI